MNKTDVVVIVVLSIVLLFFIFVFLIPQLEYQREVSSLNNQLSSCISTATKLEGYGIISNNTTQQKQFFQEATQQLQYCNQIEQQLCNNFGECSVTKQVLDSIQNGINSFLQEFAIPIGASITLTGLAVALRILLPKLNSNVPKSISSTKTQLYNYYTDGVINSETYDDAVNIINQAIDGTLGDLSVDFIQGVSVLHSLISYTVVNTVQTLQQSYGMFTNVTAGIITNFLTLVSQFINSSIAIEISTFIVDNAIDIAVASIFALTLLGLYLTGTLTTAIEEGVIAGLVALAG